MAGLSQIEDDFSEEFVEVDPTGRYGRYKEILGKGASKTVYRAFDEFEGIEVAWNQVKLQDFLQSPEDLERLYCEIHLLKTLDHPSIMKFYTSWVDITNRTINFVTEMFTSGTLRQYRLKHRNVNIRAVKNWCRQILNGLHYLHSHDPPVIHRDLKCDNIFVNGNHGEVKIGDLGLAAILRKSHAEHCVGTPEFMAPEVYSEEYNELVDIYAFGMCILELVSFEYPYSECTHPAQIYKKVVSGKKPDALYKVKDAEVRRFIEKCLATVSQRLSARELLDDPFLQTDECEPAVELDNEGKSFNSLHYANSNDYSSDDQNRWANPKEINEIKTELFHFDGVEHYEHSPRADISIRGEKKDDGSIMLRLRISDRQGRFRNIYFPFDIESDTALSVATEMVAELDMTDHDVTRIADKIDEEIVKVVPGWIPGPAIEETPRFANSSFSKHCQPSHRSTGSFLKFLSNHQELEFIPCKGRASSCSEFEDIRNLANSPQHASLDYANNLISSSMIDGLDYMEISGRRKSLDFIPSGHSLEESDKLDEETSSMKTKEVYKVQSTKRELRRSLSGSDAGKSIPTYSCEYISLSSWENHYLEGNEKLDQEISSKDARKGHKISHYRRRLEKSLSGLRWLRAKYKIKVREIRDQQLGLVQRLPRKPPLGPAGKNRIKNGISSCKTLLKPSTYNKNISPDLHEDSQKGCPNSVSQRDPNKTHKVKDMVPAKSISPIPSLPKKLHRTISLPVDAVDL